MSKYYFINLNWNMTYYDPNIINLYDLRLIAANISQPHSLPSAVQVQLLLGLTPSSVATVLLGEMLVLQVGLRIHISC